MSSSIKLSKEKSIEMKEKIKGYFGDVKKESISDLTAALILDFFVKELANDFYNQGVYDAHCYMNERVEDLLDIQKR